MGSHKSNKCDWNWNSSDSVLRKFDKDEDSALDLTEFTNLCLELFGEEEVEKNEALVQDIFDILDEDVDGFIKDEEWSKCYNEWIRVILNPVNVFLVIDVQNDFIDGTLALRDLGLGEDGKDVVEPINRLIQECPWDKVIYSLDWHPPDHISFYENLNLRELHPKMEISKEEVKMFDTVTFLEPRIEQKLWPVHCVFDSWGAQLNENLIVAPDSIKVKKGQDSNIDSYSAFFDNDKINSTELNATLKKLGATDIYACGLALDVCVCSTILDGLGLGYRVALIENCCRGIDNADMAKARRIITDEGGLILKECQVRPYIEGKKRSLVMAYQGAKHLDSEKDDKPRVIVNNENHLGE